MATNPFPPRIRWTEEGSLDFEWRRGRAYHEHGNSWAQDREHGDEISNAENDIADLEYELTELEDQLIEADGEEEILELEERIAKTEQILERARIAAFEAKEADNDPSDWMGFTELGYIKPRLTQDLGFKDEPLWTSHREWLAGERKALKTEDVDQMSNAELNRREAILSQIQSERRYNVMTQTTGYDLFSLNISVEDANMLGEADRQQIDRDVVVLKEIWTKRGTALEPQAEILAKAMKATLATIGHMDQDVMAEVAKRTADNAQRQFVWNTWRMRGALGRAKSAKTTHEKEKEGHYANVFKKQRSVHYITARAIELAWSDLGDGRNIIWDFNELLTAMQIQSLKRRGGNESMDMSVGEDDDSFDVTKLATIAEVA